MSTMTFKLTLPSRNGTTLSIDIIGTNLHVDWDNGETTTQEPNTERIYEERWFDNFVSWTATNPDFKSWTVTITGDITGVGTTCFKWGGSFVTEITLPEGLETIESYGLRYIKAEKVIIPSTVINIDNYFLYQSGVKEVVFLTENLTRLNRWFLSEATQVESVKLPEGLISFDTSFSRQNIFYNCVSLKTLDVPSTLEVFPISNTNANNFVNVQLETLKMHGGPIDNPPITENTKIVVRLSKLQDFLNHSDYPDERDRYEVYGKNLSEKIYVLGTHLAENLQNKNIAANANEGLTTLANKIHDINAPNYKELTYNLVWNDNDNEYGFRPSQFSTLLLANNEVVGGCLLPQDDDISTLYHANNIQSEYSYTTQVPESDLNGEEITYTWKPLMSPSVYTKQDTSSQNTHTTTMKIKNRRRLNIRPVYQSGEPAIDAIIDIYGKITNNDDNSERTIQFSDFKIDNSGYIIDFFTTSRVQYSLTLKAPDGYNLNPSEITGTFTIGNVEYEEQNRDIIAKIESEPPTPAPNPDDIIDDS